MSTTASHSWLLTSKTKQLGTQQLRPNASMLEKSLDRTFDELKTTFASMDNINRKGTGVTHGIEIKFNNVIDFMWNSKFCDDER